MRRLQALERASNASIEVCFTDLARRYDSVDCVLLWEIFPILEFGLW